MTPDTRFLSIEDFRRAARRRLPRLAWEYVDSGTGPETALARNRRGFDAVTLTPRYFVDARLPDLSTDLFGRTWGAPFGVPPIGMLSLLWPGGELMLAAAARRAGLPFTLSTVAGEELEAAAKVAGENFWFQLYTPSDADMRRDLIARAEAAGAGALVVTVDVPLSSRRERQKRAGLGRPIFSRPFNVVDFAFRPAWLSATLARGAPRFRTIERYASPAQRRNMPAFVQSHFSLAVTPEVFAEIRAQWRGPLIVKGVMDPADVETSLDLGADGIWVSNHGARQLDPAPAAIDVLPRLVEKIDSRAAVLFDSGVRDGGDIARAVALGAQMVFLGRPFAWAVGAAGRSGAHVAMTILRDELANVMAQLGCARPADLRDRL